MSNSSTYDLQNDFSAAAKMSMEEEAALFRPTLEAHVVDRRLPSMNTWAIAAHEVRVELLELVPKIRFRYYSESRRHPAVSASLDRRPFGNVKISNYVGDVSFDIDLVYDCTHEPHDNQLYLITKTPGYTDDEKGIVHFSGVQTKNTETYTLPHMGVVRVRTSDVRRRGIERKTDRVNFRFCFVLGDSYTACVISGPVFDAKFLDQGLAICHMNPNKARSSLMLESTILCTGASSKCRVFFESEDGQYVQEATILLRHKRFALVICVPRYPNPNGGRMLVRLRDEDVDSRGQPFVFERDPLVGPTPQGPTQVKEHLRARLVRRGNLRTDDVDDVEEEEDLRDVALWLAQGAIDPDALLMQRLANSPEAMLVTNEDGLTPLALAITTGAHEQAKAFLSHMPPRLANELLTQRLGDAHVTHLLLMAYWPSGELPLALLTALLKAGSDPEALDTEGNSLLHLLIRNEQHAALEAVLSKDEEMFARFSAVLDRPNTAGFAPLHEAVHRYHPQAVSALLSAGANVNVASRSTRFTCLHYAALETDPDRAVELTRLLLTGQGLKINEQTLDGRTATDMAEERKIQELLDLLKENGGQCLFEPSEDSDDDEDDDEEEEEEEEKEEKSQEEDGATAAAPQASEEESLSWADAQRQLLETLSAEDFRVLGRALFSANQSRLLERAGSPGPLFLRLLTAARRRGEEVDVAAALRRLGRAELAELMGRANEE